MSDSQEKEVEHLRPLVDNLKSKRRKKYTYSNPNPQMIQSLEKKKSQGFFKRNFSPLKGGSLRAVIIYWIRITTGVGVMSLPFYIKQMGLIAGILLILLAGSMSYFSFKYLFDAQYYTGKKDLVHIAKEFLPSWMVSIYSYVLILDNFAAMQIYTIVSWNIFSYFIFIFGLAKPSWMKNEETVEFYEYNIEVLIIRIVFLHVVYLVIIYFLLKRSMESLKILSILFMISLIGIVTLLFAQSPLFYNEYHNTEDPTKKTTVEYFYKPFWNLKFFSYLYSIILSFYVQSFTMSLRKELLVPSMARLKKVARLAVGIELFLFIILGSVCYLVFGDKYTTDLIILRKPLNGYAGFEWVFKIVLVLFFIFNILGIPTLNVGLRNMIIHKYLEIKQNRIGKSKLFEEITRNLPLIYICTN